MLRLTTRIDSRRATYAKAGLDRVRCAVAKHPEIIPDMYPGYREEVQAMVGRLVVARTRTRGDSVEVCAPRGYRSSDMVGLVALRTGEIANVSRKLLQPSANQLSQWKELSRSFALCDGTASAKVMGWLNEQCQDATPIEYDAVRGSVSAFSSVGGHVYPQEFIPTMEAARNTRLSGFSGGRALFRTMSPLCINQSRRELSIPNWLHEIDHLVETDNKGVAPAYKLESDIAGVISEQRGYYVARHVARYMLDNSMTQMPGHLRKELEYADQVDSVRRQFLGEGPNFGRPQGIMDAYEKAGVLSSIMPNDN